MDLGELVTSFCTSKIALGITNLTASGLFLYHTIDQASKGNPGYATAWGIAALINSFSLGKYLYST
tara:strand:+ start:220 stop:417 length:198 start_codon:yes stop_codon:yes gene_type:complete